jgi:hypothetical protein
VMSEHLPSKYLALNSSPSSAQTKHKQERSRIVGGMGKGKRRGGKVKQSVICTRVTKLHDFSWDTCSENGSISVS